MAGAPGQIFVVVGGAQRIQQADGHSHGSAVAEDTLEIGQPRFAAMPTDNIDMCAVIDGNRADLNIRWGRGDRLKQSWPKRQQVTSASRGSFGKYSQRLRMLEHLSHPADLAQGITACGAIDVKCLVLVGDPAQ